MSPLELYRYELKRPPSQGPLKIGKMEGLLIFGGHPWKVNELYKGRFVTSCGDLNSVEAKGCLSLPYHPTFRKLLKQGVDIPSFVDSYGRGVRENDMRNATRVWPAFGQFGGGKELILTDLGGAMVYASSEQLSRRFPEAHLGFRADSTRPGSMDDISQMFDGGLGGWSRVLTETFGEKEGGSIKVLDDTHFAVYWGGGDWNYTISCAKHSMGGCPRWSSGKVLMRFWDYAWRDIESDRLRLYWGPIEMDHTFCVPEGEWLEIWDRTELLEVLDVLHGQLIELMESSSPRTVKLTG